MTYIQVSTFLGIGSIAFGIISWILAISAIKASKAINAYKKTTGSFFCCIVSLALQLCEVHNRACSDDYAAIGDTIQVVLFAAVVLIFITVTLNIAALASAKKRECARLNYLLAIGTMVLIAIHRENTRKDGLCYGNKLTDPLLYNIDEKGGILNGHSDWSK